MFLLGSKQAGLVGWSPTQWFLVGQTPGAREKTTARRCSWTLFVTQQAARWLFWFLRASSATRIQETLSRWESCVRLSISSNLVEPQISADISQTGKKSKFLITLCCGISSFKSRTMGYISNKNLGFNFNCTPSIVNSLKER